MYHVLWDTLTTSVSISDNKTKIEWCVISYDHIFCCSQSFFFFFVILETTHCNVKTLLGEVMQIATRSKLCVAFVLEDALSNVSRWHIRNKRSVMLARPVMFILLSRKQDSTTKIDLFSYSWPLMLSFYERLIFINMKY